MISAIILAAGESKRMGENKFLLPWGKKKMLAQTLEVYLTSPVTETILVLGHEAERIMAEISTLPAKTVINPAYKEGLSSSLRCGLLAVNQKATGILIALGDQPGIDRKVVNDLLSAFQESFPRHNIFVPTWAGRRGHPVILSRKFFGDIQKLRGDVGAREILRQNEEEIFEVQVETEAILWDIDTRGDYLKYRPRERN